MSEEFTVSVNDRSYLLKRIYHSDLPLTYHVHFEHHNRPVVFRMRLTGSEWKMLPHVLPDYVTTDEQGLNEAIQHNEASPCKD